MKSKIKAGGTSITDTIFCRDTSVTTKVSGLTGLAFNTSSLTLYYRREGASSDVAVTLVTATLGTWTSGGFVKLDDTNMPGQVEIGFPNAAIAAGAKYVTFALRGAANMEEIVWRVELDAVDYQDAVHFGMSAVPNVAAGGSGGIALSADGIGRPALAASAITNTQFANNAITSSVIAASATTAIAAAVWNALTSGITTVGSIGLKFVNWVLGSDNKVLLSTDAQSGVTIPTVTTVTNYTAPDNTTIARLGTDYTTARAVKLDHLDADVTSRMATFSYTAPDNADIVTALGNLVTLLGRTDPTSAIATLSTTLNALRTDYTTARAGKLDHLDADISGRMATFSYTAPDNADIVSALGDLVSLLARVDTNTSVIAIKAVTDKLNTTLMTSGGNFKFTVDALSNAPQGSGGGGGGGGNGSGIIPVDHDTGGTDNLRLTFMGDGIAGAVVDAYLTSEWSVDPLTAVKRAEVATGTDGRWIGVMMLDPDNYTMVFSTPGYRTATKNVTVS